MVVVVVHNVYLGEHTFDFQSGIQGYLFANGTKMCTEICLGDIPMIQKTNSTLHNSYKSD